MQKPTHYLWKDNFTTLEEYEKKKAYYTNLGFRVVTFQNGDPGFDIHDGIKQIIKNHYEGS